MKIWKSSILLISLVVLLLSAMSVNAESDGPNDVWHQKGSEVEQKYSWEAYTGTKNNIDITDVSYSIAGSTATITMNTVGAMTPNTENVVYTMHLQASESGYYMVMYSNGNGAVMGMGDFVGFGSELDNPITGNTFTATFDVDDPNLDYQAIGFNVESSNPDAEHGEAWWDYAPNTEAPYYGLGGNGGTNGGTNGGSDNGGTPGFEIITLIAALGIAFIILRRKH